MYKSIEEAKIAVLEAIIKHSYKGMEFVITERKMNKNSKSTWYGFRALIDETFSPFWKEEKDYSWSRMVELVTA